MMSDTDSIASRIEIGENTILVILLKSMKNAYQAGFVFLIPGSYLIHLFFKISLNKGSPDETPFS